MRRRRGTGSIETYTDSSGRRRHRARLVLPTGEKKPVGVYDSLAEADVALGVAADKLTEGELGTEAGITLRQWGPKFLDQREDEKVRGIKTERNRWKNLVDASLLADIPMRQVTKRDAKAWVRWLESRTIRYKHAHPKNGEKLSRVTKQNALNLVRKAFEVAFEDVDGAPANPFAGVKLAKDKGRTHEPWTYLEPHEQTALLAAVPEPDRFLVAFALGTGLRQGEQWSLRPADVDAMATVVTVRYGSEGNPTKSGKIRRVPLFGIARDALLAWASHASRPKSVVVWPAASGDRRQKGEPSGWKGWLKAAGIERNVRWHDLRHTCASSLIAGWWGRKWTLYEVKEMLGHASITTTERYSHLADSALKLAAAETKPAVSPALRAETDVSAGATCGSRIHDLRFTKPHDSNGGARCSGEVGTAGGLSKRALDSKQGESGESRTIYRYWYEWTDENGERQFRGIEPPAAPPTAGLPDICQHCKEPIKFGLAMGTPIALCACIPTLTSMMRKPTPRWVSELPSDCSVDDVLTDLAPREPS